MSVRNVVMHSRFDRGGHGSLASPPPPSAVGSFVPASSSTTGITGCGPWVEKSAAGAGAPSLHATSNVLAATTDRKAGARIRTLSMITQSDDLSKLSSMDGTSASASS